MITHNHHLGIRAAKTAYMRRLKHAQGNLCRYCMVCECVVLVVVVVGGGGIVGADVLSIVVVVVEGGGEPPHPASRVMPPSSPAPASSRILNL